MNGINWTSLLAGVISIGSAVSVAAGYPAVGAIISNPQVATALTGVVGGLGALWSLLSPALLHSTTVAAAAAVKAK